MAVTGTGSLDFGAFPGKMDADLVITGQGGIATGSLVEAWLRPVATADHSADDHLVEELDILAYAIVAGTGFTIHGSSRTSTRLYGLWTVAWVWA